MPHSMTNQGCIDVHFNDLTDYVQAGGRSLWQRDFETAQRSARPIEDRILL